MDNEQLKELYQTIYKKLFATLWELQSTNPNPELKKHLQTELEVYYDLIGDSIDEDWYSQIESALE